VVGKKANGAHGQVLDVEKQRPSNREKSECGNNTDSWV